MASTNLQQGTVEKEDEESGRFPNEQGATQAYYAQLFELAPISYFILDPSGVILRTNIAGANFLGGQSSRLTGVPLGSFFSESSVQLFQDTLGQAFAEPGQVCCEAELVRALAPRRFTRVQATRLTEEECAVILIEIGELTQTIESLKGCQERTRIVLEQTGQIVYDMDVPRGRGEHFGAFESLLGYSADEFQLMDFEGWSQGVHPEDRERVILQLLPTQQKVGKFELEYRYRRKDGTYIFLSDRGVALAGHDGGVQRVLGTMSDITRQKLAELERHKLALLVEMSRDFIGIGTLQGAVAYVNNAGLEMVGLKSQEEALAKSIFDFFADTHLQQATEIMHPVLLQQGTWLGESCFRHFTDGASIPVELNAFVIRDSYGKPLCLGTVTRDITQRKCAENMLLKSRDQYLKLFEHFPSLIWRAGVDGRCNYFNATWLEFTGRTLEQEVGEGWTEGVHPDDLERCLTTYLEAFQARRPFEMEYRLRHSDGGYRWIVDCGRPFWDLDEQFAGYIGSCYDVDGQKKDQFEQQLLRKVRDQLTERLELVLETMPIACILVDNDFMVTYWNNAAERVFGFSKEEALFRSPYDTILRACDREEIEKNRALLKAGIIPSAPTREVKTRDGGLITCEWHHSPIKDKAGTVHGFITMALDVTERVRSQEALKQSEQIQQRLNDDLVQTLKVVEDALQARIASETALLRNKLELNRVNSELKGILDAVEESLILYSRDLEIIWSNREAFKYFGAAPDTTGEAGLVRSNTTEAARGLVRRCFDSRMQCIDQVSKGNGQILEVVAYPIFDDNGEVQSVLEMARDVTRKIHEQAEAVRTSHLTSLGELAAGVAHEINNPIHGIINYAEHLIRKFPGEQRLQDISCRIIKESERVARIVRALLDFSRKRDGVKARVRIEEILDECRTLSKSQLRKDNIRVFVDQEAADLPEVWADPQQIVQVILNLISNARYSLNEKFPDLDNNKSISFSLSTVTVDMKRWVKVAIKDQGGGIPRHLIHKVLNPFFSTKANGSGTGLGLSICNTIIAEHGGRLEIESEEGRWTEVSFLLPVWTRDVG